MSLLICSHTIDENYLSSWGLSLKVESSLETVQMSLVVLYGWVMKENGPVIVIFNRSSIMYTDFFYPHRVCGTLMNCASSQNTLKLVVKSLYEGDRLFNWSCDLSTDPGMLEDIVPGAHEFHEYAILILLRLEFCYIVPGTHDFHEFAI